MSLAEVAELELEDEPDLVASSSSWTPAIWTRPLSERFLSDGPRLRELVAMVWQDPTVPGKFELDPWQAELLDRLLERYPEDHPNPSLRGRLRYRQVVISIPRQNGKSVLGAILALYGLMLHEPGPIVIGAASSADQARVIYNRLLYVIQNNPALKRKFSKLTETRGIRSADGTGVYEIKASKSDSLQGIPVSLGLFDELHVTKPDVWQALVNGTKRRKDGLIVGITTAGNEDSELLVSLYELGKKAAAGDASLERFGFFVWEAPEARIPEDDETLTRFLLASNPALQGRLWMLPAMISDVRAQPETDAIRYVLNRFTASASAFIPVEAWARCVTRAPFPIDARPVITFDRSPDWGYGAIVATVKNAHGVIRTDLVASLVRPTLEQFVRIAVELAARNPIVYGMDGYMLRELGEELKLRGLAVAITSQGDMLNGSAMFYSKVIQRKITHPGRPLLTAQISRTVRKDVGDGFRISRRDSSIEIDAVIATALGCFLVETTRDTPFQVF